MREENAWGSGAATHWAKIELPDGEDERYAAGEVEGYPSVQRFKEMRAELDRGGYLVMTSLKVCSAIPNGCCVLGSRGATGQRRQPLKEWLEQQGAMTSTD